ncbi:MAG: MerR family transcriptional regulator [Chloroflexota bacterium]
MPQDSQPVSFTTREVSHIVGASPRRLAYWDKTGLLSPSLGPASGRGSRRLYSLQDIIELKLLLRLLKSSMSLQRVRASLRFIRERPEPLASLIIMTDGKTIYLYQNDNVLVDTLKHGQAIPRIVVQDLITEVQQKVSESFNGETKGDERK